MVGLSREEKLKKAASIISDLGLKQSICNEIVGVSFKDIDRVLKDILDNKKPSKEAQMEQELEQFVPEKLHPEIVKSIRPSKQVKLEYLLDQDEVNRLINASEAPYINKEKSSDLDYPTYSEDEVEALLRGDYDPTKSED